MHNIPLPDPLYVEAARFAAASGQSVEAYVTEAVRQRVVDDAPTVLSPEQAAIVRQSQKDMRDGKGYTMAQVEERLAANKAAWLRTNPS